MATAFERATDYASLGWLAPGGLLQLPVNHDGVRAIRVEAPEGVLALELLDIDGPPPERLAAARVRASQLAGDAPLPMPRHLAADAPGAGAPPVPIASGQPAWIEVSFPRPVPVQRLRIRMGYGDGPAPKGVTVDVRTRFRTHRIYDGQAQRRAWKRDLAQARAAAGKAPDAQLMLDVLDLVVRGRYERAHALFISRITDDAQRRVFSRAVNAGLLQPRELEWTTHGARRSFRYWSHEEQVAYVAESSRVVDALRPLTRDVCFGFGSVLAAVRDHALIPHDDDLDIAIAFEPAEVPTIAAGLARVEEHLRSAGYTVTGSFYAHRHVHLPVGKPVDVFVGIFEGDAVSWFPSARRGLTRSIVFPPSQATLLGVTCAIPAQPEAYLLQVYGEGWRTPDPDFMHPWDRSAFADLSGS